MPNTYFQFKQFRVSQDRCAMKVTTEGCLLGALVNLHGNEQQILDIGTGTGLLSLMLAQRSGARIDAVELDTDAAQQASENFEQSPWADRLTVKQGLVQELVPLMNVSNYDLIVSNPPFFKGHLKSGTSKDRAIHNDELSTVDLAEAVAKWLTKDGRLWVIYPRYEFEQFISSAKIQYLKLERVFDVYDRPGKPLFRKVGVFGFSADGDVQSEDIVLKDESGEYSDRFRKLVQPYYLHL